MIKKLLAPVLALLILLNGCAINTPPEKADAPDTSDTSLTDATESDDDTDTSSESKSEEENTSNGSNHGSYDQYESVYYDNYEGVIADAAPMTEAEREALRQEPVIAMYRGLLESYRNVNAQLYANTTHFTVADVDANGIPDLLLRTSDFTYALFYDDLEKKELFVSFGSNQRLERGLLTDGSVFSQHYFPEIGERHTSIFRFRPTKVVTPVDHSSYTFDQRHVVEYDNRNSSYGEWETREAWLAHLREQRYQRAYWYELNSENLETYLPCDAPAPFTHLNFADYESFLDVCRMITSLHYHYKYDLSFQGRFDLLFDCTTQAEGELYHHLNDMLYDWFPPSLGSYSCEDAYGYAIKDLNGDGVEELLLISGASYGVLEVFTMKNGMPVVDDTAYGFERKDTQREQLEYLQAELGLDVKPLFPQSDVFDPPKTGK